MSYPHRPLLAALGAGLALLICAAAPSFAQVIDPPDIYDPITDGLRIALDGAGDDDWIEILVVLDSVDKGDPLQMPVPERIEYYRDQALGMQKVLLRDLAAEGDGDYEILDQNWLLNSVLLRTRPSKINKIAKRKDVRKVSRNGQVRLIDPELQPVSYVSEPGVAWGAHEIGVEDCWQNGIDGSGVVVVHMDTGVDPTHPALSGKFTGYWFDAINGQETPYDDNGHGTHTLGTLLGGDGLGAYPDDLGVAPGARWAGVKVMNADGVGTYQQCLAGLEYVAQLKAKLDVRVVCGSWSLNDPKEDLLFPACERLRSLGILPVFALGNAGPGPRSADAPGNYPSVVGVGAVNADGHVAPFSARGNAPAIRPWNDQAYWSIGDWNLHKPDLVAPGVDVRSCVPGGGFRRLSGTSMAAPHVAGVAALMLQRNPALDPKELLEIMIATASRPGGNGTGGYTTAFGWGRIDAACAVAMADPGNPLLASAPGTGPEPTPVPATGLSLNAAPRDGGSLLRFALPRAASVRLVVYNVAGQAVRTLAAGEPRSAGPGEALWDGRDDRGRTVVSGVYFARLSVGGQAAACKFVLVR